jgi:tetraacyldisaccharide 4'-kinase
VPLEEPSWWYLTPPSGLGKLLLPLGSAYGLVASARFRVHTPYRPRLPVICIGNFTAGGTGKTPLAIHICKHLADTGQQPVALTRGYGGRRRAHWVDTGTDAARDVGDEPLLLARSAPTRIGRDRAAAARAIENGPHPATVIVMDDGLQNPTLAKSLTLAVVDGARGLGNGLVMPAGPLRAPLEFQLGVTDAIVVTEPTGATGSVSDWLRRRFAGPVLRARLGAAGNTDWLHGARLIAWAGIAAPQRFFAMLEALGAELTARVAFRDHYRLRQADAQRLLALAERQSAALITTAKDGVRLGGERGALRRLAEASRIFAVELEMIGADSERLAALIDAALAAPARLASGRPS